jgi:NTP pyrophosphatase (non-canonical NTP hydrolase)
MDKYQQFQKSTEKAQFDLKYMGLGIGGEVGEVLNEIKKLERDDNNILTKERKLKIMTELGDVMWYLSGICSRIDCSIEDIVKNNIEKLGGNR